MKRTKVYRPRRGVHFSDDRGPRPLGGFVGGGDAITPVSISMASSRSITGSYGVSPQSTTILTGSAQVARSIGPFGRLKAKAILNNTLLSRNQTGLGYTATTVSTPYTASNPSWTHKSIGFNQSFVGVSLSSSYYETKTLNYYRSGSEALESSPVPASSSIFYSKNNRLQTIVVKHSASAADLIAPSSGVFPPFVFAPGTGTYLTLNTGSTSTYLDGSAITSSVAYLDRPTTILMNVPVTGRLVDIKVWVELLQISSSAGQTFPLATLGIALRSPNVRWGNAHPIRNDQKFILQTGPGVYDLAYTPFSFYRDTFLLWEGSAIGADTSFNSSIGPSAEKGPWQTLFYEAPGGGGGVVGGFGTETMKYPCWQRDRCMRTVFSDGSPVANPRHLTAVSPSGNYNGVPCTSSLLAGMTQEIRSAAFGFNVPWTSDGGGLTAGEPKTYVSGGSPPKGWLNGAGGVADVGEWPTTGVNYGTPTIRPFYPLLDPIFGIKDGLDEPELNNISLTLPFAGPPSTPGQWRGFRPGLRGTEISGTWQLLFVSDSGLGIVTGSCPLYFKQARLEITYESAYSARPAVVRKTFNRYSAHRAGTVAVCTVSGSDSVNAGFFLDPPNDFHKTIIYTTVPGQTEIARTFGVAVGTGTIDLNSYALSYKLSGTLADISGTGPGWLTNNQFGMPMIPESSASLVAPSTSSIVSAQPLSYIVPQKTLDGPRRLADVASDINPQKTLVELATDFVSASLS